MSNNSELKMIEKISLGVVKLGVFMALLNQLLIVRNHIAPFHFGKLTAFRVIMAFVIFFYINLLYLNLKKYAPKINILGTLILVYFVVLVITSFTGVDYMNSFWGSIERMGGLYNYAFYIALFLIMSGIFQTREDWDKIIIASVAISVYMAFYAMGQKYWLGDFFLGDQSVLGRPVGSTGNALFLATYLMWSLFFIIYLLFRYKENWQRGLLGVAFLYNFWVFLLVQGRGAFFGIMGGFFAMLLVYAVFVKNKKLRTASLAVFILMIIVAGSLVFMKNSDIIKNNTYINRYVDVSFQSSTVKTRMWTWGSGWQGFLEKPVFGWGMENFNIPFSKYYNPNHFNGYGSETWFDRAHNTYLDVFVDSGVIGVISYLALWGYLFWYLLKKCYKDRDNLKYYVALGGAAVAYCVQAVAVFNTYTGLITLFMFLGFINFLDYEDRKMPEGLVGEAREITTDVDDKILTRKQIKKLKRKNLLPQNEKEVLGKPNYVVLAIVGIAFAFAIFKIDIPSERQNYWAGQALAAADSGRHELVMPIYQKALGYKSPIGDVEIIEKLSKYAVEVGSSRGLPAENIKNIIKYAIDEQERMLERHPVDTKARLILGRLYNMYWDYGGKDQKYLDRAQVVLLPEVQEVIGIKDSPLSATREQIHFELGQTYILMGRVEDAVKEYRTARDLTPTIGVSNYYYAMSLFNLYKKQKNAGDEEGAKKTLAESLAVAEKAVELGHLKTSSSNDALRMANIYWESKALEKLVKVYEERLEIDTNNIQLRSALASTYRELGDKIGAFREAMKIKELEKDPEKIKEVDAFMESLNENNTNPFEVMQQPEG